MKEQAEILRRSIALYRRYLADGVDADLAKEYLAAIVATEAELARIENHDNDKRVESSDKRA
jgi:hypothetical protein